MLLNVHDPDERKGVQKCSPSSYGLLLCSVEKKGDVFVSSKDMAVKEFTILYDIRCKVMVDFNLKWHSCWHIPAQKACEKLLQKVWEQDLPKGK